MPATLPPYPDVDPRDGLADVLEHLTSRSARGGSRPRDPDEPEVRWLLEAGIAAVVEEYLADVGGHEPRPWQIANPLFGAVTLEFVMGKLEGLADRAGVPMPGLHKSRLLTRWGSKAAYDLDLVNYIYRPSVQVNRIADVGRHVVPDLLRLPFGEFVDVLATAETIDVPEVPILHLQTVLTMIFPKHREIKRRSAINMRAGRAAWAGLYERILGAYGIGFREPDYTYEDLAGMLNVIVNGVYARRLSDPGLGLTSTGVELELRMIQMILAEVTGRPWEELRDLRAKHDDG